MAESKSNSRIRHNPTRTDRSRQTAEVSLTSFRQPPTAYASIATRGADIGPIRMSIARITKRVVDSSSSGSSTYLVRDTEVKGFVLVVTKAGAKSYAIDYRAGRGRNAPKRRFTIGKHGSPWTPETARKEARRKLGEIAHGIDPLEARQAQSQAMMTVADLCERYLEEGMHHKKVSTIVADRGRIKHHILPRLGRRALVSISKADVEKLMRDVSDRRNIIVPVADRRPGSVVTGGRGAAGQCVALLGAMFSFAQQHSLMERNPASGVKKPPVRKMTRFLSNQEISKLSGALQAEEVTTGNPFPASAIRLLLLTGCRKGEILRLRWDDVDLLNRCLRLPDSKTGPKVVFLNEPSVQIISNLPREVGNPLVIAGSRKGRGLATIDKVWSRVRTMAELRTVRIHDLRHSYASIGASHGLSLPIIGALLGHKHSTTTARYAHLSDSPVRSAAALIGDKIGPLLAVSAPTASKT